MQWCEEHEAHSLRSLFVCCRVDDLTHPEEIGQSAKCDRTVALYGYVRGIPLLPNSPFHMPGCRDLITALCPILHRLAICMWWVVLH